MTTTATIALVIATTSLVLQNAGVSTDSSCAMNYDQLSSAFFDNQGNRQRLRYTFLPPNKATPDQVNVYYHINGTAYNKSFESYLGCNVSQNSSLRSFDYQYIWSNTDFLLQVDFDLFRWGTFPVRFLSKSCIELVIIPFCNNTGMDKSSEAELMLTLTTWLRSYTLDEKETMEGRDYAMEANTSGTFSNEFSVLNIAFACVQFAIITWASWIPFLLTKQSSDTFKYIKQFLVFMALISLGWFIYDTFELTKITVLPRYLIAIQIGITYLFGCFILLIILYILIVYYRLPISDFQRNRFYAAFFLCYILSSVLCSPIFVHIFWLCIALSLYPVRVGSILVFYILLLAVIGTFTYIILGIILAIWKLCKRTECLRKLPRTNPSSTDADTNLNTSTPNENTFLLRNSTSTDVRSNSGTFITSAQPFENNDVSNSNTSITSAEPDDNNDVSNSNTSITPAEQSDTKFFLYKFRSLLPVLSLFGIFFFLIGFLLVYINTVSNVNIHSSDPLNSLVTAIIPSAITGITLWILRERIKI